MVAPPISPIQQVVGRRYAIGAPVPRGASSQSKWTFGSCDEVRDVHREDHP